MSSTAHHRRFFLSLPRDYFRRRRLRRWISNAIFIPLLSIVVAYVITRPTGGSGFSLPISTQEASLLATPNPGARVPTSASAGSERSIAIPANSGTYKLADGPLAVMGRANLA